MPNPSQMHTADVALIGAGPIGLEMAVALKFAGIDYVHLDAKQIAHTISWFPRQVRFFSSPERISICGVPLLTTDQSKASREEYLAYLQSVTQQFELRINTYQKVTKIARDGRGFVLTTDRSGASHEYHVRRVILAIGDMHRPRQLTGPDGQALPGSNLPHVISYFDEPYPFVGQQLLIVGGKNSAVEAAIRCYRAGAKVSISYRRQSFNESSIKYWLRPEINWLIKNRDIQFYAETQPIEITPNAVSLAATTDGRLPTKCTSTCTLQADFVLLMIGYVMENRLLTMAGVELQGENQAARLDPDTMETNVPGLYVAGTSAAGTQIRFRLFIENCHSHVVKILRHIAGRDPQHINPLAFTRLNEIPMIAES